MTHRFFIPPAWLSSSTVTLQDAVAHQIKNVLRMEPGHQIIVLDNSGQEWRVTLTKVAKKFVEGEIIQQRLCQGEPTVQIILYQGTLKRQKFEWVLQKGTELGIQQFVPTICHRSVINKVAAIHKKRVRWQRILQEAAEQSGRGKIPTLAQPIPFSEAIENAHHQLRLIPWEKASSKHSLKAILRSQTEIEQVALFIGPEGGFDPAEIEQAQNSGIQPVTLGPRILRAETAGLALCAVILYERDEWIWERQG